MFEAQVADILMWIQEFPQASEMSLVILVNQGALGLYEARIVETDRNGSKVLFSNPGSENIQDAIDMLHIQLFFEDDEIPF